jgi:CxxC motif-containing protein (DUF1111 family)
MKSLLSQKRFWIWTLSVSLLGFCGFNAMDFWSKRMTPEKIAAGKVLFEHEWTVDDPLSAGGDGLGPVFNASSCAQCHSQGGLGGAGGNENNVLAFEVLPSKSRRKVVSNVVHADATREVFQESVHDVAAVYPMVAVSLQDSTGPVRGYGSSYNGCGAPPTPPSPTISDRFFDFIMPEAEPTVDRSPVIYHELNSPALFGVGIIDDIHGSSIALHNAKRTATKIGQELQGDFRGTTFGMARTVKGGMGKFGWKGQFSNLEDFVASACAMELGLSNPKHSQSSPREFKEDRSAKLDMNRKQLNELVAFVRSLPRPEQVIPADESNRRLIEYGESLFNEAKCADCHVRDFGGVPQIYTDFHLYNLEDLTSPASGYIDEAVEEEFRVPESHPEPDQWQTPPLWGVADTAPYFHDGASPSLKLAILRHKGDAIESRKKFKKMAESEQDAVIAFLNSLRAPAIETWSK